MPAANRGEVLHGLGELAGFAPFSPAMKIAAGVVAWLVSPAPAT
jgi:hypothetical protein